MPIILGGPTAYRVRRHGDIAVAFHWINKEPAMVLYPHLRKDAVPFAIPLHCAWAYAEDAFLVEKAALAAGVMGMGDDKRIIFRIAGIINDALPDLLGMPPEPAAFEYKPPVGGEMVVKVDGQTVANVGVH